MPMRPRAGSRSGGAPEEIVVELVRARRLERMHLAALRIDAGHHVLDDAVLAGGVHALQHDQHRPLVVRVEPLLQFGEPLDVVGQHRLGFVLVEIETAGVGGVERREPEAIGIVDAKRLRMLAGFMASGSDMR